MNDWVWKRILAGRDKKIAELEEKLRGVGVEQYYALKAECREQAAEIRSLRAENERLKAIDERESLIALHIRDERDSWRRVAERLELEKVEWKVRAEQAGYKPIIGKTFYDPSRNSRDYND